MRSLVLQLYAAWLRGQFDAWEAPLVIARVLLRPEDRALAFHAFYDLVTGAVSPASLAERSTV